MISLTVIEEICYQAADCRINPHDLQDSFEKCEGLLQSIAFV